MPCRDRCRWLNLLSLYASVVRALRKSKTTTFQDGFRTVLCNVRCLHRMRRRFWLLSRRRGGCNANASGIATLLDSCKQHIEDCRARPARKTLSCQTLLRMLQEAVNATSSGISGWSSNAPSLPSQSGWGLVDSFMIIGTIDGMVAFQQERVGCVRAEKSRRRMAIHRTSDEISCNIAMHGQWEDCKALAMAWKLAMSYPRGRGYSNAPPLFVDIGANIGACTLHMLSCADLSVVAFEALTQRTWPSWRALLRQTVIFKVAWCSTIWVWATPTSTQCRWPGARQILETLG